MTSGFARLAFASILLSLAVIVMGAYVRLSDAGLSCPDWPGCYGRVLVPSSELEVARANAAHPDRPLSVDRAWKEMIHRYLAGALGVCIATLALLAYRRRREPSQPFALPLFLLGLVIFQAMLGMWTVTLLLKPLVVTAHLVGGMATLALLWWLWLRRFDPRDRDPQAQKPGLRTWALLAMAMVIVQLTLGGWTSANYAALACPEFPTCRASWWPDMAVSEAFQLWRELGEAADGAPLSSEALVAIQMVHRLGAVITLLVVGLLAVLLLGRSSGLVRAVPAIALVLLVLQIGLGISTVLMIRPLLVAVAHNAVAALLLLAVVTQYYLASLNSFVVSPELRPVESPETRTIADP